MKTTSKSISAETLGKRLARLRQLATFTQSELAAKVGVDSMSISRIERDVHTPGLQLAAQIATAIGVTLDELFFGKRK